MRRQNLKPSQQNKGHYLFPFIEEIIVNLRKSGRYRTSETYKSTLNSFRRFRGGKDIALCRIDSCLIYEYQSYLKCRGLCPNSISFYMRILRAVYNRAVTMELVVQSYPFKGVYTGVDKTIKRAVSLKTVRQIKEMDLSGSPKLDFARDMFLFSFYTRGMSFIDMAFLHKKDLSNGFLTYRRSKTGQQLCIKWERCMQDILDKHDTGKSVYLLPVILPDKINMDERLQYTYSAHKINRSLKIIGSKLNLTLPLTMYVARHTWASIAKSKNIPISVISDSLGHDSETTTRIYLASLDNNAIDKANLMILKLL